MKEVVNVMESLVKNKYDEMKDELEVCQCLECKMDVIAYALNHLPPKYVATEKGEVLYKLEGTILQFESDIIRELILAAKQVNEFPRHSIDNEQVFPKQN